MDELSLKIKKVVTNGEFERLKISNHVSISHSFFVDDILLMGMINGIKWFSISLILKKFGNSTGLFKMNKNPSFYIDHITKMISAIFRDALG